MTTTRLTGRALSIDQERATSVHLFAITKERRKMLQNIAKDAIKIAKVAKVIRNYY